MASCPVAPSAAPSGGRGRAAHTAPPTTWGGLGWGAHHSALPTRRVVAWRPGLPRLAAVAAARPGPRRPVSAAAHRACPEPRPGRVRRPARSDPRPGRAPPHPVAAPVQRPAGASAARCTPPAFGRSHTSSRPRTRTTQRTPPLALSGCCCRTPRQQPPNQTTRPREGSRDDLIRSSREPHPRRPRRPPPHRWRRLCRPMEPRPASPSSSTRG